MTSEERVAKKKELDKKILDLKIARAKAAKAAAQPKQNLDQRVAGRIKNVREGIENRAGALVRSIPSGLLAGYDDELGAGIVAPFASVASMFTDEPKGLAESYQNLKGAAQASKAADQENYPLSAATGEGIGMVGPAALGGKLVQAGKEAYNLGAKGVAGLAGLVGATEGGVMAGGNDGNVGLGMALGGVFGAAGETIGRAVGNFAHKYTPAYIQEQLAKRVFGSQVELGGPTADVMTTRRKEFGDEAFVADTSPELRSALEGVYSTSGVTPSVAGDFSRAVSERDVALIAEESLTRALAGGPRTMTAYQKARREALDDLNTEFEYVLDDMDSSGVVYSPQSVERIIRDQFVSPTGAMPQPTQKAAMDEALKSLRAASSTLKTGADGTSEVVEKELLPRDLVTIRQELDKLISRRDPDGKATMDRDARARLISLKTEINDKLKADFPDYADIMPRYSTEFEMNSAWTEGASAFKTSQSQSIDDVRAVYDSLSNPGKESFREGFIYSMAVAGDTKGATSLLAREAGPTAKNRVLLEKVESFFGPQAAEQMIRDADALATFSQTNNLADKLRATGARATAGDQQATNALREALDNMILWTVAPQGRYQSGVVSGAAGRVGARQAQKTGVAVNDAMLKFAGQQGDEADTAIMNLKSYFDNPRKPSALPFNLGGVGGVILGAED